MTGPTDGLATRTLPSPIGPLTLVTEPDALVAILWPDDSPLRVRLGTTEADPDHPILHAAAVQLAEYFNTRRTSFDLPLRFRGTPFQQAVWAALLDIPHGQTRSYADIARAIGRPTACRAVGAANARNPLSIVAPCHRVIGTGGALTGFAGGLHAKTFLLDLERAAAATA